MKIWQVGGGQFSRFLARFRSIFLVADERIFLSGGV